MLSRIAPGKKGIVKPDASGYYTVHLGAYGAHNSAGMFYDLESAARFFLPDSPLMRRLNKECLYGEMEHPCPAPGESMTSFLAGRARKIDSERWGFHIRKVWLEDGHRDEQGRRYVAVLGEIKPVGRGIGTIDVALESPDMNCYFSVRSITGDDLLRGIKYTKDIITWDFVTEGGIATAHKFNSPGMEDYQEGNKEGNIILVNSQEITQETFWQVAQLQKERRVLGFESMNDSVIQEIAKDMNWDVVKATEFKNRKYLNW